MTAISKDILNHVSRTLLWGVNFSGNDFITLRVAPNCTPIVSQIIDDLGYSHYVKYEETLKK